MSDYATLRRVMVDTQVRPSDVTKFPIIQAMLTVPREAFLPVDKAKVAYVSDAIDIGPGRTVLAPRVFAKMVDALDVTNDMLVLDIGCGYGYSAAVLAHIAEAVVAVEEDTDLASDAPSILSEHGADNVVLHEGALKDGAPDHGPYDAIMVEGGVETLPDGLADQLKDGGRIACLFVEGQLGTVRIGYKIDGHLNWRYAFNASAPVLPGFAKTRAFAL
ncbi:protein-L-isoaspartate O-methyltransferase family protein [Roseivivax sp. CAU 1753]